MNSEEATLYHDVRRLLECTADVEKWWTIQEIVTSSSGGLLSKTEEWLTMRVLQRGMEDCRGKHFEFRHQPNTMSSDVRYQVRTLVHCTHPECLMKRVHSQ